jgi:predicted aspartyl protease
MKFFGYKPLFMGGYFISAKVASTNSRVIKINFLIDTGCTVTTICYNDAVKMDIDFNKLIYDIPTSIADGNVLLMSKLENIFIVFESEDAFLTEKLDKIYVKPFYTKTDTTSLLGLDIIERYSLKYNANTVTLER